MDRSTTRGSGAHLPSKVMMYTVLFVFHVLSTVFRVPFHWAFLQASPSTFEDPSCVDILEASLRAESRSEKPYRVQLILHRLHETSVSSTDTVVGPLLRLLAFALQNTPTLEKTSLKKLVFGDARIVALCKSNSISKGNHLLLEFIPDHSYCALC